MKSNYKLRLHNMVGINVNWVLKSGLSFVFTFLDERLTNKIQIFSDNGNSYLKKLVGNKHLEKKHGGKLPNKKGDFFPPRYNPLL